VRLHGGYDDAVDVVELAVDLALRDITRLNSAKHWSG
jgi:hypothetical protein